MDIDTPILADFKRLQKQEQKSLGWLVSDLFAVAIGKRRTAKHRIPRLHWIAHSMNARVDIVDKSAVLHPGVPNVDFYGFCAGCKYPLLCLGGE